MKDSKEFMDNYKENSLKVLELINSSKKNGRAKTNAYIAGGMLSKVGPVIQKLYDTLTGIQMGRIEAPEGWIKEIKVD